MGKKAPLALIELIVMLMIFAICAAVSLQAFAISYRISSGQKQREEAAVVAQSEAETIKANRGVEEGYEASRGAYTVRVTPLDSPLSTLGKAEIAVFRDGEEPLFSLTAAWQEVAHE